jgi:hypothetical protein
MIDDEHVPNIGTAVTAISTGLAYAIVANSIADRATLDSGRPSPRFSDNRDRADRIEWLRWLEFFCPDPDVREQLIEQAKRRRETR